MKREAQKQDNTLVVELGTLCNNGCRFCSQTEKRELDGATSPQTQEVMARLKAGLASHDYVVMTGGEPTLFEDLPLWVKEARSLGYERVSIQTNGRRLAYKSYTACLIDAGVTDLEISLYGTRAVMHDYHTQVEGSFKQTVSGIREASRAGLSLVVHTLLTRSNYRHGLEFLEVLAHLRISVWHISMVFPVGGGKQSFSGLAPSLSMLAPHLDTMVRRAKELGIELVTSGIPQCVAETKPASAAWGPGVFGKPCNGCHFRGVCPGLSEKYVEAFGWQDCHSVAERGAQLNTLGEEAKPLLIAGLVDS